eukprot:TRINITY_DN1782_c1_g1_i2.p1 TRINITY_DN1782_c1_g1~~TRINITY_DN1782_c1_g1_i2.p1  ORF type:complete len:288 (-),score=76.70 TRINITY_DN1782_c1_g1_i2:59-922(-)
MTSTGSNKCDYLDPKTPKEFSITSITSVKDDVLLIRVALPDPETHLGLPVGYHVRLVIPLEETPEEKHPTQRSYTPVSLPWTKGYFDLMIRIYPEGKMSQYLAKKKEGDTLWIKGPGGRFLKGNGYEANMWDSIIMICGGTGITPMLQVMHYILQGTEGKDQTQMRLLFANRTEDQILVKEELDQVLVENPEQVKVSHFLTQIKDESELPKSDMEAGNEVFYEGRIGEEDVRFALMDCGVLDGEKSAKVKEGSNVMVLVCGSLGFNKVYREMLKDGLGLGKEQFFVF